MATHTHTEIDATSFILGQLPPDDRFLVAQAVRTGSRDNLIEAISAQVHRDFAARRAQQRTTPAELVSPEEQDAWSAAVDEGVHKVVAEGQPIPDLTAQARCLVQQFEGQANDAQGPREHAAERLQRVRVAEAELHRDEQRFFDVHLRPEVLRKELRKYQWLEMAMWFLEGSGITSTLATYMGLFDSAFVGVQIGSWLVVLALALVCTVTSIALNLFAAKQMRSLARQTKQWVGVSVVGLALVFALLLLFAGALGILRWWSNRSVDALMGESANLDSLALGVLIGIATLVPAALAVWARLRITDIDEQLKPIEQKARQIHDLRARFHQERDGGERELERWTKIVETPARLRAAFEGAVQAGLVDARKEQETIAQRCGQALSAYDALCTVPLAVLDAAMNRLYELVPADGTGPEATLRSVAPSMHKGTNSRTAHLLSVIVPLLIPFTTPLAGGCEDPPPPDVVVVACDGTGTSKDDVCSHDLLARLTAAWSARAVHIPGSALYIVTSADSYGTTQVHRPSLVVPDHWAGDIRAAKERWRRQAISTAEAVEIPRDEPARPSVNRSDLLSLVLVSAEQATLHPDAKVRLVFASDGWLVSLGFNAQQQVPTAAQVMARLNAKQVPWDLSAFSEVDVCGFTNDGTDSTRSAARRTLWTDLFRLGHAPAARIRPTCQDLVPPVPAHLLGGSLDTLGTDELASAERG